MVLTDVVCRWVGRLSVCAAKCRTRTGLLTKTASQQEIFPTRKGSHMTALRMSKWDPCSSKLGGQKDVV